MLAGRHSVERPSLACSDFNQNLSEKLLSQSPAYSPEFLNIFRIICELFCRRKETDRQPHTQTHTHTHTHTNKHAWKAVSDLTCCLAVITSDAPVTVMGVCRALCEFRKINPFWLRVTTKFGIRYFVVDPRLCCCKSLLCKIAVRTYELCVDILADTYEWLCTSVAVTTVMTSTHYMDKLRKSSSCSWPLFEIAVVSVHHSVAAAVALATPSALCLSGIKTEQFLQFINP